MLRHRPRGCDIPRSGKDAACQLRTLAADADAEKNRNELLPSPPCGSKMTKRTRKAIVLAKGNGLTVTVVERKDHDLWGMMTLLITVTCNSKAKVMNASTSLQWMRLHFQKLLGSHRSVAFTQ